MYNKISDYGIIGNLSSIALIGLNGSIDWLCLPYIDSPSVFGALLDDEKGGRFSITPADTWDSTADYLPGTNVLTTRFRTRSGVMQITDFMPVRDDDPGCASGGTHELYRRVEVLRGEMTIEMIYQPRPDYAKTTPSLIKSHSGVLAEANSEKIFLASTLDFHVTDHRAEVQRHLSEGEEVWLLLSYGDCEPAPLDTDKANKALHDTIRFWRSWLERNESGVSLDLGPYRRRVERSALVLKLLYYNPTGTIAAAATTSLPEEIGGERNWDYRYTWVRDTSFTLQALFNLGHLSETEGFLRWIECILSEHGADRMQIMYGLRGEEDLPEQELTHLDGYKGSKPVRIGNAASRQTQLDIYGELMEAALKLSDYVGKIDSRMWPFLRSICDHVVDHWQDRDFGIWEVRGGPYHFVYSKIMCWVALDRGLTIARRYGFPADMEKWRETAEEIKREVLEKGWNEEKGAFVQHFDTDALDASNLLIPISGFLPFDHPKVVSTIEAIQQELGHDGFLYRYVSEDGLSGGEGAFLLCTFWLIDCLIGLKRLEDAEALLHRMEKTANHLGLFSEEYDLHWREALGNFPQAFTHIGYINSVIALRGAREAAEAGVTPIEKPILHPGLLLARNIILKRGLCFKGLWQELLSLLFPHPIVLNSGEPTREIDPQEIAVRLKRSMNTLRGAFFNTHEGRVAYERMKKSEAYRNHLELSYSLKEMDLRELETKEEKTAFWINMYNVIVIHGVAELGIRDSVKEVIQFLGRVQYQIGDMFFTPDDIEHGILRGNRRPPHSLLRLFTGGDKRLRFSIKPMDPRIHFALVCASSSCPPIELYTGEDLDRELTIAGRTFINAGGVKIDKDRRLLSLSRIFKWYACDFGSSQAERLKFIAPYLYSAEDRDFLRQNAASIQVTYQEYDWRLNRN